MTIKMGPALVLFAVTPEEWAVRALFVFSDVGAELLRLTYEDAGTKLQSATSERLLEWGGDVVCAYDLVFKRGAKTMARRYALEGARKQKTFVPAKTDSLHFAYASCAGFHDWKVKIEMDRDGRDPWGLWNDMLAAHQQQPFHLLILGGDQIYIDQLWVSHESPMDQWRKLSRSKQKKQKWDATLDKQARDGLMSIYCSNWAREPMAAALATIPSLMMWDDHDICDGWGSHPDDVQACAVMQGLFGVTREFFQAFQLGRKAGAVGGPAAIGPFRTEHFSSLHSVGEVGILTLDLRSRRKRDRVLFDEAGWLALFDELSQRWSAAGAPKHLLVISSVPVVYVCGPSDLAGLHPWDPISDPQDDLIDQWSDYRHHTEREILIRGLLKFSRELKTRVSLLCGDVHVGAMGIITSDRDEDWDNPGRVITQLVSSAIVNAPPSGLVLWASQQIASQKHTICRDVTGELVAFGDGLPRLIPSRNWLSIRLAQGLPGGLAAKWNFEGGKLAPTKLIAAL